MTMCEGLSDRMVAVRTGRAEWTADEAAHLASCDECQAEWRLFDRMAAIGADLPPPDAERIAALVRQRLDSAKVMPLRLPVRWIVGLAAAAIVVLAVRLTWQPVQPSSVAAPTHAVAPLSELDELTEQELETVLTDLGGGNLESELNGMGDLNTSELEQILQSWES